MKIKDLIIELKKLNPNHEVLHFGKFQDHGATIETYSKNIKLKRQAKGVYIIDFYGFEYGDLNDYLQKKHYEYIKSIIKKNLFNKE